MVARPLGQPALHRGVLVRGVVVQHQMDVRFRRHPLVDQPQERDELLAWIPKDWNQCAEFEVTRDSKARYGKMFPACRC